MSPTIVRLLYLASAVLFITGLKQLQSPETARQGNRIENFLVKERLAIQAQVEHSRPP